MDGYHGWDVVDMTDSHGLVGCMRRGWVGTDRDWMGCGWMERMHRWDVRVPGLA